ncbi:hypothetical protein H696_04982 [Fonticula alba]|uniref:ER membrane protein complex subunit 3 n=1 Tax=Fonticula alba TaxID=691883 RepID=A0A058Z320_FONAL|nr:hypothetical protein H696_04982 [Fonticula alba]KCV68694.1 hypothetical protein H696_04982 [Fonticula alba]|eukprot:XP_009497126.1 hypothetical protein H696_04982 [Fonticula alba]
MSFHAQLSGLLDGSSGAGLPGLVLSHTAPGDAGRLALDPEIRNWVVLPIAVLVFLVFLLRANISKFLGSGAAKKSLSCLAVREREALVFTQKFLRNSRLVAPAHYAATRERLLDALNGGTFLQAGSSMPSSSSLPGMTDPAKLQDMMSGVQRNMLALVPNSILMLWVNTTFRGFVVMRVPLMPPVFRLKLMLQSGIDVLDLAPAWVSSLSLFFLCLFGLRGVFDLCVDTLGLAVSPEAAASASAAMINPGAAMLSAGTPDAADPAKALQKQSEILAIHSQHWLFQGSDLESRFLADCCDAPGNPFTMHARSESLDVRSPAIGSAGSRRPG